MVVDRRQSHLKFGLLTQILFFFGLLFLTELPPWSWVVFEHATVTQLLKNVQNVMEAIGQIPCPQQPSSSPQVNSVHSNLPYFSNIFLNIVHLCLSFPNGLLLSGFTSKPSKHFSSMRATFPTRLILLDLMNLITFGEEYKLLSFLLTSRWSWLYPCP
jgi:hypothetical protein